MFSERTTPNDNVLDDDVDVESRDYIEIIWGNPWQGGAGSSNPWGSSPWGTGTGGGLWEDEWPHRK